MNLKEGNLIPINLVKEYNIEQSPTSFFSYELHLYL